MPLPLRSRRQCLTAFTFLIAIYFVISFQIYINIGDRSRPHAEDILAIQFNDIYMDGVTSNPKTTFLRQVETSEASRLYEQGPYVVNNDVIFTWRRTKSTFCDGKLQSFQGHFVSLRNAIFSKSLTSSSSRGDEDLRKVTMREESAEYFQIKPGFFALNCSDHPEISFSFHQGHLNKWLANVAWATSSTTHSKSVKFDCFTIVVKRYEYANFYHAMTDYYAAYLMMKFFKMSPEKTCILLFDAHPRSPLDQNWYVLFNTTMRVSNLPDVTRFEHVVWSIPGYDTPMAQYNTQQNIPLIEDFRTHFLRRYNVTTRSSRRDCRNLRLVAIWRRDYVAHARNPSGKVARKIANEDELLVVANYTGYFSSVTGVQMDNMTMKEQLTLIANTDVLVGMHGAGLSHIAFLPKRAGVIELFPFYSPVFDHFSALARWRNIPFIRWKGRDARNELPEKRTIIPPSAFRQLLKDMKEVLC